MLGLGTYKLLPQFSTFSRTVDELCLISGYTPDEIETKIKNGLMESNKENDHEDVSSCHEGKPCYCLQL